MENYHPAFRTNEYVYIQSTDVLKEIYEQFARETEWVLNPISLFAKNMMDFAGKRVQIIGVSCYHLGIVLYKLKEIYSDVVLPGQWLERTLIDQDLGRAEESPMFQVANQVYRITRTDEHIEIRDDTGLLYCALRKRNLASDLLDVARVASLRSAVSFSHRYNFDGIESTDFFEDEKSG